jgi:uncharacterized protein YbbC (DUF1343 family)
MGTLGDYKRRRGYANWNDPKNPMADPGVFLRWLRFIPAFHKYRDECCFGFHLIRNTAEPYHALGHALRLIRFIAENCESFAFLPGPYEKGNDKTAIEILAGDPLVLEYLSGSMPWEGIQDYFREEERAWIERSRPYLFYDEPLFPALGF